MRSILACVVLAACIPATTPPTYGYGQPQPQAQRWTCTQIFECFATCSGDQPCARGCLSNGDGNAQATALASLSCVAECGASTDEDCVTNQCSAQVEACRATGPAVATAPAYDTMDVPLAPAAHHTSSDRPRQPVSNANILPWLVGDWIGNNFQFQFFSDGRVRRSGSAHFYNERNSYQCSLIVNEIGRVTQDGDFLIMTFGAQNTNDCRDRSVAAGFTVRYLIDWKENYSDPTGPLQLILREQNCNRGGTMYCDDPMRRR